MTADTPNVRHVTFGRQRVSGHIEPRVPPGRRRHPAATARPARHGPRFGPHRPRPRRQ